MSSDLDVTMTTEFFLMVKTGLHSYHASLSMGLLHLCGGVYRQGTIIVVELIAPRMNFFLFLWEKWWWGVLMMNEYVDGE